VASKEVEEVLFQHPAVAEAAVFGLAHPHWIEVVTAAVVFKAGQTTTGDELIAHARQHLAGYKVPKLIAVTDSLPKNPSGKILKRELRNRYAHLANEPSTPS
jgi:fatty-acyl-CoA synthase